MMVPKTYVIFGAGGHAGELHDELERNGWSDGVFVDEFEHNRLKEGRPVLSFDEAVKRHSASYWYVAIGDPKTRESISRRLMFHGLSSPTFVSKHAIISPTANISEGAQIFSNSVISSNVEIGRFVMINFNCVVSHDVKIADFCTITPGVRIAGNVQIGQQTWVGLGAVVKNGQPNKPLLIGEKCMIGASSCVVRDVVDGAVVAGVPARALQRVKDN